MKKSKDSGIRPDLLLKPIPTNKKNSKGTPTTQPDQDTKISLPQELLSQMEKDMKKWKEFHQPQDQDELVHGREPSLRSIGRDESIDHVFCEDSVIVLSSTLAPEGKTQNKAFEAKKGLFSGFPLDFTEGDVDSKETIMNSSLPDGCGKGNLNHSGELPVNREKQGEGLVNKVSNGEGFGKINGVIANPAPLFEGKPYLVMSVQNDLAENKMNQSPRSYKLHSSPLKSEGRLRNIDGHEGLPLVPSQDNLLRNEMETLKIQDYIPGVHDLNAFLQDQLLSHDAERPKYREVPTVANQDIDYHHDNEEIDYHQLAQRTDLITRAARRAFEEQYMMSKLNEMPQPGQFFKKNLSVIFSTGKSMDTSVDSHSSICDQKDVNETSIFANNENTTEKEKSQVLKEGSFLQTENESDVKPLDQKKLIFNKEPELSEAKETLKSRLNNSAHGDKESKFLAMLQNILIQNKENKTLETDLLKLSDIYHEEMNESQRKVNSMTEKMKKYKESNLSLVEVVKNWEKEIEQLAVTNKNLHDLVVGLQEELFQSRKKEADIKDIYLKQKAKINKLKDRAKRDLLELEEARRQLKSKENKINTIMTNTQGYESLIKTVNINLKALVKEKNSNKLTPEQIYKILEAVENKTSKVLKDIALTSQAPIRSSSPLGVAFRDKLNVCLTEEAINPLNEVIAKSYRHPSPGEANSASARGFNELKKYDSLPVSNRSGTQKSPLKRMLTSPYPSQLNQKKSASPLYKSVLTPKEKPQNLPSYYTKKSLTHRLPTNGEKKHYPSLSYRAGDERGRSIEEEESSRQRQSKSREKSAPETKARGTAKDNNKRGSQ